MSTPKFSLNKSALKLVNKLIDNSDKYDVVIEKLRSGTTLIDAGIKARGGFQLAVMVTEICLGGYGNASISPVQYGDTVLPSVFVTTDYPALSTLGSQLSGWRIAESDYVAFASGPARALAMKPMELYEKLAYKEESETAVLVLETEKTPSENLIRQIANACGVSTKNLYLILFSANSMTGAIQACGRIVEVGMHKLERLGLDPIATKHAWGYAPIVPMSLTSFETKARANDAIRFGGVTSFTVEYEDENQLNVIVNQASASSSKMLEEAKRLAEHDLRYRDIFKETGYDPQKIDPDIFAPAIVAANNLKTGNSFRSGTQEIDAIKRLMGIS